MPVKWLRITLIFCVLALVAMLLGIGLCGLKGATEEEVVGSSINGALLLIVAVVCAAFAVISWLRHRRR